MYSSGGMTNILNPFPSFPLHYYQQDQDLEDYSGHKLIKSDAASAMSSLSPTKKKLSAQNFRKDRHSKIVTAQGPRDRRVRLSIPVARKFFDLHDTLGLDKASETLDWLLTNSQAAIDDLVKSKHCSCSTTVLDEGCSRSDSINELDQSRVSMRHEEKKARRISSQLLARVTRAKARARARERTRQKMCSRHLFEFTNKLVAHDFRIPADNIVSTWNDELSYNNKSSRAPYFNQVGQSTIYSEITNLPTGARLCEAYNNKFNTRQIR